MKKPLHKHIGHHARKIHGHVTKYLYERDTIFATLWVFLFIVILGSIPLNLGFINPIKLGLKDFDSNDMVYSKLEKGAHSGIDSNIVIINIGHADREGISLMIEKTASYQPKVMALDAVFDAPKDSAEAYQDTFPLKLYNRKLFCAEAATVNEHRRIKNCNFFIFWGLRFILKIY